MKNYQMVILILFIITLITPIKNVHNEKFPTLLLSKAQYTPHQPVVINGNAEFSALAQSESWEGDGSSGSPYIIEGLIISSSWTDNLISISNTDVHFQLRNCYLSQGGVDLDYVSNGQLINNTIANSEGNGIRLGFTTDTILENNLVMSHHGMGIHFYHSTNNIVSQNQVVNNTGVGIHLLSSENNLVLSNVVMNNGGDGVVIYWWDGSFTELHDNFIANNKGMGIFVNFADEVILSNNHVISNTLEGIRLRKSYKSIVQNNFISNNSREGILIEDSIETTIRNNELKKNSFFVIGGLYEHWVQTEVTNNSIDDKTIIYWQQVTGGTISNENTELVYLVDCNSVEVTNQDLAGIVTVFSNLIHIHSNIIRNGKHGIYLYSCSESLIEENTMNQNRESGIYITNSEGLNQINNNILNNNSQGIYLDNIQNAQITNNVVNGGGINLRESTGNHIINNTLIGDGVFMEGYDTIHYVQAEMVDNSVNGKPLIYWHQITGGTVPNGTEQIILVECTQVQVIGQEIGSLFGAYCSQLSIHSNVIMDSRFGIFLIHSTSTIISENMVSNISGTGIYLEDTKNSIITENTIRDNQGKGIQLLGAPENEVLNNLVTNNNEEGIYLEYSGKSILSNNIVSNNEKWGIRLFGLWSGSPETTLRGNTVESNNEGGICLYYSGNCELSKNVIKNNGVVGIYFSYSGNNVIIDNYLENNCVQISSSQHEDYYQSEVTNNTIDGKPLIFLQYEVGKKISQEVRQVILVECASIEISNLDIVGIMGVNCTNLSIENNKITNGYDGISLIKTRSSKIFNNSVFNMKGNGIYLEESDNNIILNNTVINVKQDGILLRGHWDLYGYHRGDNNYLQNNLVATNGGRGIVLGDWHDCSDCAGHPYYSNYAVVVNNTVINNNGTGVSIVSYSSIFYGNIIANNLGFGIHFRGSSNCTLFGNLVTSNEDYGVYINSVGNFMADMPSSNNTLYYNDFLNNRMSLSSQACDNEFDNLFSNNYWDDWTEPDNDHDGIVDEPYNIDGLAKNKDDFPFASPHKNWTIHVLFPPRIIYPNGREIISQSTRITWIPAFDTFFHTIKYSVYYSPDGGNIWVLIIGNVTSNEVTWNVRGLMEGSFYMIKVIALCSNNLSSIDISDEPFSIINSDTSSITSSNAHRSWSFTFFITSAVLVLLTLNGQKRLRKF